jgi:hypothetical protein
MPNDAYHTKNARDFGDWDIFSIVDSRDLERLSKGDVIQIIEAKYNENVYKLNSYPVLTKIKIFMYYR